MMPPETTPEERIVLATIDCIERDGLEKLTVRSIAKEARVNSAAINYYFRSKERLLARVMETTLDHLFEDLEEIAGDQSLSARDALAEILDYLIDGATRYPGITRAHMHEAMNSGTMETPFAARLNAVLARLEAKLQGRSETGRPSASPVGAHEDRELTMRMIALFSAVMLPSIMPALYRGFSGLDFRDSRARKAYVRSLVDMSGIGGER